MNRYKVLDILKLANEKYSLYFDADNKSTQINTYTKQIRKILKRHGYVKTFNNISVADAYYLVDHELKDYFISNSNNRELLEKDDQLAQKYEDMEERMIDQQEEEFPDDALSHDSLGDVIDSIKNDEYDPISKLKEICTSNDDELGGKISYLDKLLSQFKQEYIFHALLKLNNEEFNQRQFIKDFFERDLHIDDRSLVGIPMFGFSKYNDKLSDPISAYISSCDKNKTQK